MSRQAFEEFMQKLAGDEALRGEASALARDDGSVPLSSLADLAAANGYRFSVEDVSGELGDEQLDAVAGGVRFSTGKPIPAFELFTTSTGEYLLKIEWY